jgi:hypothetical protein
MVKKGKYDKYFCEADSSKFMNLFDKQKAKPTELNHFDYRDNEEAPHFMEIHSLKSQTGPRVGRPHSIDDPRIYYSGLYTRAQHQGLPNCRLFYMTRSFISLDPDHLDDIGTTMHVWMGEGKEAELHTVDKATSMLIPVNTVAKPLYPVESHGKPGMMLILCDSPLEAIVPFRGKVPPGFENSHTPGWIPPTVKPLPKGRGKYGRCFSEIDASSLPVYTAHQGKLARVMFYNGVNNPDNPHCIDCHLVYKPGVGFGLGDECKLPVLSNGQNDETSSYEPFLPHRHPFYQTFSFSPADNEIFPDLGGTVEFWIGEGDKAEQHFITSATTVLIPKNTVHLPMYVREVHHPFTILTVLDTPIWAGCWSMELPKGFKL